MKHAICCVVVTDRDGWHVAYRVYTIRDGVLRESLLSIPLTRRIAPLYCERHGITDQAGLFVGAICSTDQ